MKIERDNEDEEIESFVGISPLSLSSSSSSASTTYLYSASSSVRKNPEQRQQQQEAQVKETTSATEELQATVLAFTSNGQEKLENIKLYDSREDSSSIGEASSSISPSSSFSFKTKSSITSKEFKLDQIDQGEEEENEGIILDDDVDIDLSSDMSSLSVIDLSTVTIDNQEA